MLWGNAADRAAQIVLIYCYTGMRPTELVKIKTSDIFLAERYIVGGIKNKTSKNRAIPISEKIYKFIEAMYDPGNEYLLTDFDGPLTYDRMNWRYWKSLMEKLDMDHLPHDGRHTCATLLDNVGANKTMVKKTLGHAGLGTTEKVYTHKTIQQLVDTINLISFVTSVSLVTKLIDHFTGSYKSKNSRKHWVFGSFHFVNINVSRTAKLYGLS